VTETVVATVNGRPIETRRDPTGRLIDLLREDLGLTGTVEGCSVGVCGSCTVLVNDRAVSSCLMFVGQVAGRDIKTIEGMAGSDELSDVQSAFVEAQAFQCGYCTPGFIMVLEGLFRRAPVPSDDEIMDTVSANLCRCGCYKEILQAARQVAAKRASIEDRVKEQ
jgi:aerobic-type carbon monoxide dehydrogenase small subunit (CoxS/CutS family)